LGWIFCWYGFHAEGIRTIKCNADERCPLRLDAAEHLFSHRENANESLQVHQRKNPPFGVDFFVGTVFTQKGFEPSNATRMSVARCGSTQRNIYFRIAKMQTNPFKSIL